MTNQHPVIDLQHVDGRREHQQVCQGAQDANQQKLGSERQNGLEKFVRVLHARFFMRDLSDDFDGVGRSRGRPGRRRGCSSRRRICALIRLVQGGQDIVPWSEGLLVAVPQ